MTEPPPRPAAPAAAPAQTPPPPPQQQQSPQSPPSAQQQQRQQQRQRQQPGGASSGEEEASCAVRHVDFLGARRPVVMQNRNGPCPLLAVANVLLLRRKLPLRGDAQTISLEELTALVAGHLLDANERPADDNAAEHVRQNVADTIAVLPKLATGLDVNVRFDAPRSFEFTGECALFDLLDITLCHGWVVDDAEPSAPYIARHSYNTLVDRVIALSEQPQPVAAPQAAATEAAEAGQQVAEEAIRSAIDAAVDKAEGGGSAVIDNATAASASASASASIAARTEPSSPAAALSSSPPPAAVELAALRDWLDSTQSQLTTCGLAALKRVVRERQLCVFFRNNHFNTLFKLEGELYLLATDQGFIHEDGVVWERLSGVSGDTSYCAADFKPYQPRTSQMTDSEQAQIAAALLASAAESANAPPAAVAAEHAAQADALAGTTDGGHQVQVAPAGAHSLDSDFALALALEQEEREAEERRQRERREREAAEQQRSHQQAQAQARRQQAQLAQQRQQERRQQRPPPKRSMKERAKDNCAIQ